MSAADKPALGRETDAAPSEGLEMHARIALATRLARQGAYTEAEGILRDLSGYEQFPAALDLLARICAQQGRVAEAEEHWAMALRLEAGNPAFGQGLEYLGRLRRSALPLALRFESALVPAVAVLIAVLFGSLLVQLRSVGSRLATVSGTVSAIEARTSAAMGPQAAPLATGAPAGGTASSGASQDDVLHAVQTQQAELLGIRADIEGIRSSQDVLETQLMEERAAPEVQVDHPMVVVVPQPGAIALQFKEGLFLYGAVLRPEARVALVQVGQQLEPYVDRIRVDLVGYQANDETGEYFDLGMMRAMVVFRLLQDETQLPARMLSVQTSRGEPAPYPNDSALNRSRNRTVIWIISAVD